MHRVLTTSWPLLSQNLKIKTMQQNGEQTTAGTVTGTGTALQPVETVPAVSVLPQC